GLLRLEDAVRKMTWLSAAKLGLRDRGLLEPGQFADITLFDPGRVIDRSTYTDPFHYSEGIEYVIVNGAVVLEKGAQTAARPGGAWGDLSAAPSPGAAASPVPPNATAKFLHVTNADEGPAWQGPSRSLYFCGGNRITRLDGDGTARVFRDPSGGANG